MVRTNKILFGSLVVVVTVVFLVLCFTHSTGAVPLYEWKVGGDEIGVVVSKVGDDPNDPADQVHSLKLVNAAGLALPFKLTGENQPQEPLGLSSNSPENHFLFEEVLQNRIEIVILRGNGVEEQVETDKIGDVVLDLHIKLAKELALLMSTDGKGRFNFENGEVGLFGFTISLENKEKLVKKYLMSAGAPPIKLVGPNEEVVYVATPYFVNRQDVENAQKATIAVQIIGPDQWTKKFNKTLPLKLPAVLTPTMTVEIAKDDSGAYVAKVTPGKPGDPGIDPGGNGGKEKEPDGTGKAVKPKGKLPTTWGDLKKK